MKCTKLKCNYCGREISASNMSKHIRSHENGNYDKSNKQYHLDHDDLYCKFCSKEYKNKKSLCQHEIRCKNNPDRIKFATLNFKNGERPAWNKGMTKETDERVKKNGEAIAKYFKEHPEKCRNFPNKSRKYKYKYGTYRGYYCDSSWELAFVIYNIDNNIIFERNTTKSFTYYIDDTKHEFFPDFLIDDTYYEIKGGYDTNFSSKLKWFPKELKLIVLDKISIQPYISYCITKYGKNFITLYDRNYPSWMDKIDLT